MHRPLNLFIFWPCIDGNKTDMYKAQQGKDIVKIVHVTSVVQPKQINDFIKQFLLLCVSLRRAFMRVPWRIENKVQCQN